MTAGTPAVEDYTGHELDDETGMHYAGARYHMSALGRWNGPDPRAEKYRSHSPYSYSLNRPLYLTDPGGDTVRVYSEVIGEEASKSLHTIGTRHAFLRVTTDELDLRIELYGQGGRRTGRPVVMPWDEGQTNRPGFHEAEVTRPEGVPEGDDSFELGIVAKALDITEGGIESLSPPVKSNSVDDQPIYQATVASGQPGVAAAVKSGWPALPDYGARGPNSNGFVNYLVESAGGDVDFPFMVFYEDVTQPYEDSNQ